MAESSPKDRLIVALDVDSVEEAGRLVERLGDAVSFYKIGLELAFVGGLALAAELKGRGQSIFLDMKLHDIPNQVERATAAIARLGVDLLTVHAYPQTMAAAARGRGRAALKLLAVTVLTSMSEVDAAEAGYAQGIDALVARRAQQARLAGMDGIVCSPMEAHAVRGLLASETLIVTPGIRPASDEKADQSRVATPKQAIIAGATHLVVGRPITRSPDPRAAAEAILAEMMLPA